MKKQFHHLSSRTVEKYQKYLQELEKSPRTVQKYLYSLRALQRFLEGRPLTKTELVQWKGSLAESLSSASVNTMIAAVNGYLKFSGLKEWSIRPLKIQRSLFCDMEKELTRKEYERLVDAARQKGDERLGLILQTICTTGIRVSELRFITAESVRTGRAVIDSKGKRRVIFLPEKLRRLLAKYLQKQKKTAGAVFVTRMGNPVDRSNIWREMKKLCKCAHVDSKKVFPHNLRHLFARTYYTQEKDLSRLADILGHSSVNTTRIYTAESGGIHAQQINRMSLVITT